MTKVGILGSGDVAKALARGFQKHGYQVAMGTDHPEKLSDFKKENPLVEIGAYEKAALTGDPIVLCVKGTAAEKLVERIRDSLVDKTVIDTTNPLADAAPANGVLKFFTTLDDSLMERLQRIAPRAKFVKAFNSIGSPFMVNPDFGGQKPTMFICGNDAEAKKKSSEILGLFGFEVEDVGMAEGARAIEPLSMLWCIPGFLRNEWTHAFKLLKK
jgi:predicted dinucleotide-binding enzyme